MVSFQRFVFGLAIVLFAGACGDSIEPETAADWASAVEQRLVEDSAEQAIIDCVLNVARVDLERNPLSEAATDELVTNCEAARSVIDGAAQVAEPPTELLMTDQPVTFGDDPTLDALWTACEDGSGEACDQLFSAAPIGSDYEEFGVTCGARPELLHCGELDVPSETDGS